MCDRQQTLPDMGLNRRMEYSTSLPSSATSKNRDGAIYMAVPDGEINWGVLDWGFLLICFFSDDEFSMLVFGFW